MNEWKKSWNGHQAAMTVSSSAYIYTHTHAFPGWQRRHRMHPHNFFNNVSTPVEGLFFFLKVAFKVENKKGRRVAALNGRVVPRLCLRGSKTVLRNFTAALLLKTKKHRNRTKLCRLELSSCRSCLNGITLLFLLLLLLLLFDPVDALSPTLANHLNYLSLSFFFFWGGGGGNNCYCIANKSKKKKKETQNLLGKQREQKKIRKKKKKKRYDLPLS